MEVESEIHEWTGVASVTDYFHWAQVRDASEELMSVEIDLFHLPLNGDSYKELTANLQ